MFWKIKLLCLNGILLIIFHFITPIQGHCKVAFPFKPLNPTIYKIVGSHKLKIHPNSLMRDMYLYENQEIEAECDTKFEQPRRFKTTNKLYIRCNNDLYVKSDKISSEIVYSTEISLKCSSTDRNMYESSNKFTWCPANVTSYILAKHKRDSNLRHNYLAGICYDINKQSFSSAYYTLAPKHSEYAHPSVFGNFYTPSLQIQYIRDTFDENSIKDFDNEEHEKWITHSNYEYSTVMQHPKPFPTFNLQFLSPIEFVWWPNLRLYNWKSYETALEEHVENDNKAYDILAGVSGAIKAPIIDNCQTNYTLKEVIYGTEQKIPLYVWNYLQARDNSSNEIVIIGFNSPFNEFYSEEEIVFCPDKCQEIPWLKKVSSTFRYGIMGTVFCCDVEVVKSSKHLDGFPENDMQSIPAETTTSFILNHEPIAEDNNSDNTGNSDNNYNTDNTDYTDNGYKGYNSYNMYNNYDT